MIAPHAGIFVHGCDIYFENVVIGRIDPEALKSSVQAFEALATALDNHDVLSAPGLNDLVTGLNQEIDEQRDRIDNLETELALVKRTGDE